MTMYDMGRRRPGGALAIALVMAAGLLAAARADEPTLVSREYADLACRMLIPATWSESPSKDPPSIRFRRGARALRAEVTALAPRRDLDEVERRLRASGREVALTMAEAPRRLTIDGRPAIRMLFEGERAGTAVKHLVVAVDAPTRTYIVMIGDRAEEFDLPLAEKVAGSLERTGGAGATGGENEGAPAEADAAKVPKLPDTPK